MEQESKSGAGTENNGEVWGDVNHQAPAQSMLRSILSVIVGYIAMFFVVFATFTVAYLVMGEDRAFKDGLYEVSTLWIVTSVVLGTIAAISGGIVCGLISRHSKGAVKSLMILVLVLGGLTVVMEMQKPGLTGEEAVRAPGTSNSEAMMNARQPMWALVTNPIIGCVGVFVGASLVRPKSGSVE